MLHPPDAALARRDPALPGLGLLLDTAALSRRLQSAGVALPDLSPAYIRYKPGTSCLVAYRIDPHSPPALYAVARNQLAGPKLLKARPAANGDGFATALLADEQIEVRSMLRDAELKAIRRVLDAPARRQLLMARVSHLPELFECSMQLLAYKPERRFVARLRGRSRSAVLRLYTSAGFAAAEVATAAVRSNGTLRIPAHIGCSRRHRALLLEWLPGTTLNEPLRDQQTMARILERVGAALALLHDQSARSLTGAPAAAAAGNGEIAAVAALRPQLVEPAAELADKLRELLMQRPAAARSLHGDFHRGQVVVMDGHIGFLDLDRAHRGDPASDPGTFLANLERDAIAGGAQAGELARMRDALFRGYGNSDPAWRERVHLHTAAGLLRLVSEPFRYRAADWPGEMDRIVARAGELAELAGG
jgi:aminoglycoside phosphotransferase (APT) family kinase protein